MYMVKRSPKHPKCISQGDGQHAYSGMLQVCVQVRFLYIKTFYHYEKISSRWAETVASFLVCCHQSEPHPPGCHVTLREPDLLHCAGVLAWTVLPLFSNQKHSLDAPLLTCGFHCVVSCHLCSSLCQPGC